MQNTTEIKVLGAGTSKHQMVTSVLREYLSKAEIPLDVNDYTDVDGFLKEGLESIPAIVYGKEVFNIGSNGTYNKSLRTAVTQILKKSNFGEIEKIVIPVDFSDVSTNAFAFGHRLATDLGAVTKALHVFFPSARELKETSTVNIDFSLLHESYLQDLIALFDTDWGSDLMRVSLIDGEFRTGFPSDQILESIEDNAAALTIMGSTGKTGLIRKWFGSVSTRIMNESPSPVIIVPKKASYKGINRIAFAYDNIKQDKAVLDDLIAIADRFGAEVHLIHVENGGTSDPGYYISELVAKNYPSAMITTSSISTDDIASGISNYCEANSIDLVALSTHQKGFFERLFDDNISEQMTVVSNVPLLILK